MSLKSNSYSFSTFEEMIAVYLQSGFIGLEAELDFFRKLGAKSDVSDAIKAEAVLTGYHQRYLNFRNTKPFKNVAMARLASSQLWNKSFVNFEMLYDAVSDSLKNISYIKDITKYDVAKRIGAMLENEIQPQKFVYIQNGAKIGAEALLEKSISKDIFRLSVEEFTPYFRSLSATHIENILCIMKDYFVAEGIKSCETDKFNVCIFNYQRIFNL